jgi:hypothetical protein
MGVQLVKKSSQAVHSARKTPQAPSASPVILQVNTTLMEEYVTNVQILTGSGLMLMGAKLVRLFLKDA